MAALYLAVSNALDFQDAEVHKVTCLLEWMDHVVPPRSPDLINSLGLLHDDF